MLCLPDWNESEVHINKFRIDLYSRNARQKMNLLNRAMSDLHDLTNQVARLIIIIIYVYLFGFPLKRDTPHSKDRRFT